MKKAYISGPMTGYKDLNFDAFNDAATHLRALGWQVVNPVDVNPDPSSDWLDCIAADLLAMRGCTAIVFLPGYERSYGARIEELAAEKLNLDFYNIEDLTKEAA